MKNCFFYFCQFILVPITNFFIKEVRGKENIPANGSFITASNHLNGWDHCFILSILREKLKNVCFIGAMDSIKTLLQSRILYYLSDTIIINRKKVEREEILKKIIEYLKEEKIIVIYPEGNTNSKRELLRGKTGMAELALRSGSPVIPIGIIIEGKGKFARRVIKIGKPLRFSEERKELKIAEKEEKEYYKLLRRVTDKIMREISKLCGKPYSFR